MKFWQPVNWMEPDQMLAVAQFAEEVGFEGVMNADHAFLPVDVKATYPYSESGKPPMNPDWQYPDCFVSIAAMAAVTTRLKFSNLVYVLPLRNPFEVAKATGTVAILSNDRFVLGAGVGWMKDEFDVYGVDFKTRGRRMDEMITVMQKLWRGGVVEHSGEFFSFDPLRMEPAVGHDVPIYFGGESAPALRRAAAVGDGWISVSNTPVSVPGVVAELRRLRKEAGREKDPFETIIALTVPPNLETFKRLYDEGMTAGMAVPFNFQLALRSPLDEKKRVMEEFAEKFIVPMTARD